MDSVTYQHYDNPWEKPKPELSYEELIKFISYLEFMKNEYKIIKPYKDCITTLLVDLKFMKKRIEVYGKDSVDYGQTKR